MGEDKKIWFGVYRLPFNIRRDLIRDCLFLIGIVLLSLILYVRGVGFYLDDWAFLGTLSTSGDQSFSGLSQALYFEDHNLRQRPVQLIYIAGLYRLFGVNPLGYHLVNAAVLMLSTLLLYLVLRELALPRLLALSVPLIYALLPHYSTDRFWIAAFQSTLSIALYFLSTYSDLRALRNLTHLWGWKLLSLLCLIGCSVAYEVALPLFLVNPLLIVYRAQELYGPALGRKIVRENSAILIFVNLFIWCVLVGVKSLTTDRLGIETSHVYHIARIIGWSISVNYGVYGIGLPYIVLRILRNYFYLVDWTMVFVGSLLGLIIFWYLNSMINRKETQIISRSVWIKLTASGLVFFALGYVIFFNTNDVWFTSAGLGNRIAIAAAIGVAMSFVGVIGYVSTLSPSVQFYRRCFCLLTVLLSLSGFLIINTLAKYWVIAYRQELRILADIHERFPTMPAGSTLILDGICQQLGPAVVFTSHSDLTGALITTYHDPTLRAVVVLPNLKIEKEGLSILSLGHKKDWMYYSYNQSLLLYNFDRKTVYQLPDVEAANRYFQTNNSAHNCPPLSLWK
jgi:hypothetical protein